LGGFVEDFQRFAPTVLLTVVDLAQIEAPLLNGLARGESAGFDDAELAVLFAVFGSFVAPQTHGRWQQNARKSRPLIGRRSVHAELRTFVVADKWVRPQMGLHLPFLGANCESQAKSNTVHLTIFIRLDTSRWRVGCRFRGRRL
jgi:hypothetical protein